MTEGIKENKRKGIRQKEKRQKEKRRRQSKRDAKRSKVENPLKSM